MKTLITSQKETLTAKMDLRFGRAHWFCIYNDEDNKANFKKNPFIDSSGGAGTKTAEMMLELGVNKIISGHFGPKAKALLEKYDIQLIEIDEEISIESLINKIKKNIN